MKSVSWFRFEVKMTFVLLLNESTCLYFNANDRQVRTGAPLRHSGKLSLKSCRIVCRLIKIWLQNLHKLSTEVGFFGARNTARTDKYASNKLPSNLSLSLIIGISITALVTWLLIVVHENNKEGFSFIRSVAVKTVFTDDVGHCISKRYLQPSWK